MIGFCTMRMCNFDKKILEMEFFIVLSHKYVKKPISLRIST